MRLIRISLSISLSIFLGDDYISFAETTIKNQYYKGVYTAMREMHRYDVMNYNVDYSSGYYLYEGKTFKSPVTFFDDLNPEIF